MPIDPTDRNHAVNRLEMVKASLNDAVERLRETRNLLGDERDRYAVYDVEDALYGLKRLSSDVGETIAMLEKGPDIDDDDDFDVVGYAPED